MIFNGKENKEAGAICFEIRIPRKKNKELLQKVPSKIYGSNFIMEKKQNHFLVCQLFRISSMRNGANRFLCLLFAITIIRQPVSLLISEKLRFLAENCM